MIIKACERGGGNKLALHLLNDRDNDHVEVHEVSGFVSQNLQGAMNEAYAVSKGTMCKKFLFSVILSPPANEAPDISDYEHAAKRIESNLGLSGQPRVFVFHEKEGRRHAHVVWTRINSQQMKAINLPYYRNKLNTIAKELYLEYGWNLPQGFIDREMRNPLNFTLKEWQQAKRLGDDPRLTKAAIQACWKQSNTQTEFINLLENKGFYLAKGDRRGYVVVDWRGEVYSLTRSLSVKKRDLKDKLGEAEKLKSVDATKASINQNLVARLSDLSRQIQHKYAPHLNSLRKRKNELTAKHRAERDELERFHKDRLILESQTRQARFRNGLLGFWDRLNGKHRKIKIRNQKEAIATSERDNSEKYNLKVQQITQAKKLQEFKNQTEKSMNNELIKLRDQLLLVFPDQAIDTKHHLEKNMEKYLIHQM